MIEVSVSERNRKIRDFINGNIRVKEHLISDRACWHTLCSAMGVIGDVEVAIYSYENMDRDVDKSFFYIVHYGVLQALQIQQDAVRSMCECIGAVYGRSTALENIKKIRARAVGHPTRGNDSKLRIASFISRGSLSYEGFVLSTAFEDGRPDDRENINIAPLIESQKEEIHAILVRVHEKLKEIEARHRKQFMDYKLITLFSEHNDYSFKNMWEGVLHESDRALAYSHIGYIKETITEYESEVTRRQESYDKDTVSALFQSIEKLSAYFENADDQTLTGLDAYIYLSFLEQKYEELRKHASCIDDKYANVTTF